MAGRTVQRLNFRGEVIVQIMSRGWQGALVAAQLFVEIDNTFLYRAYAEVKTCQGGQQTGWKCKHGKLEKRGFG